MEDMILGMLGGLLVAVYWYFQTKKAPDHTPLLPVQEFYDANYAQEN